MVKNPPADVGDTGSIPGLRRFPGEGNGNPLQYSCLRNPRDRGAWRATVHRVTKESDTTKETRQQQTALAQCISRSVGKIYFKDLTGQRDKSPTVEEIRFAMSRTQPMI